MKRRSTTRRKARDRKRAKSRYQRKREHLHKLSKTAKRRVFGFEVEDKDKAWK